MYKFSNDWCRLTTCWPSGASFQEIRAIYHCLKKLVWVQLVQIRDGGFSSGTVMVCKKSHIDVTVLSLFIITSNLQHNSVIVNT
jgi:hypothetical protein